MDRQTFQNRLLALFLVALLHAALVAIGIFTMFGPRSQLITEKPVEVTLDERHVEPPPPPPLVKLETPHPGAVTAPHFDVVPESQSALSSGPQNGPVNNGSGGKRGAGNAPLRPPPPDPQCGTTIEAYNQLVHEAIARYVRYPQAAQLRGIEGAVIFHSISDTGGRVLVHSVTTSVVSRTFSGRTSKGGRMPVMFVFQRIAAAQWNYRATINTESGAITLGQGTLSADPDGTLRAAGADPGTIAFPVPAGLAGDLGSSSGDILVQMGKAEDLFWLEESVNQALEEAQPLPKIPSCLHLQTFNGLIGPFSFQIQIQKGR